MRDARPWVIAFTGVLFVIGLAALISGWTAAEAGTRAALPLLVFGVFVIGVAGFFVVALSKDPTRRRPGTPRPGRVATVHTLSFSVGEHEKHRIVFTFDQMWGWLTISVDDRIIVKRFVTMTFRLNTVFDFEVGENERHDIRIEKSRPLFFAFANPQPTRAFADGVLVAEDDGVT